MCVHLTTGGHRVKVKQNDIDARDSGIDIIDGAQKVD
jgi:hypothetical protein